MNSCSNIIEDVLCCFSKSNIALLNISVLYTIQYKVEFKSSASTFQIARFLVAPSVWKLPFDCLSLCHVVLNFYDIWM